MPGQPVHRSSNSATRHADADGRITVQVQSSTRYLKQVADSDYKRSTRDEVVVAGQIIFVSGKVQETTAGAVFFANYVWNPPPDQRGPGIPNPKPSLPRDLTRQRPFYVRGYVTQTEVPVANALNTNIGPGSRELGFVAGAFESYGTAHTEQIARAHSDRLRLYIHPQTKYWTSKGRTDDKSAVIRHGDLVFVTGKYTWDGNDWRFLVSNVFNPPPGTGGAGGPLRTTANVVRTAEGEFDPDVDSWVGTRYEGKTTNNFDGPSYGTITTDLTWYWHPDAYWEVFGTYTAQKEGSPNRLEGTIDGVVIPDDNGTGELSATLSVDAAYGHWAGWVGSGSVRATATFLGDAAGGTPPANVLGDWRWTIGRPDPAVAPAEEPPAEEPPAEEPPAEEPPAEEPPAEEPPAEEPPAEEPPAEEPPAEEPPAEEPPAEEPPAEEPPAEEPPAEEPPAEEPPAEEPPAEESTPPEEEGTPPEEDDGEPEPPAGDDTP